MAPLLPGQTIALSGSHPDYKQGKRASCSMGKVSLIRFTADLNSMIKQNGGNVAAKVTDACTHLITTQKDFTAQSSKGDNLLSSP